MLLHYSLRVTTVSRPFFFSELPSSHKVGPDSSVSISTRYGLDGPGIESRWRARFSAPVQTGPGARRAFRTMGTGFVSQGVKRPGILLTRYCSGDQIEKNEMAGACSTQGRGEVYTGSWWGNARERDHSGDPVVGGRIVLR